MKFKEDTKYLLLEKTIKRIPTPGEDAQTILNALGVNLPNNT
ncbi:MAG: hypothetical protein SFH39_14070 [Candidatus Magnetobacterium sp. LHC-1]